MKTEEITVFIKKIVADEGMILTDGNSYGTEIFLSADRTVDEFYEITKEEYKEIKKAETEEEV